MPTSTVGIIIIMTMIVAMPDDNDNIYIFKQDF